MSGGFFFFSALQMSTNDCEKARRVDVGVKSKFWQVGKFANTESVNNEVQPYFSIFLSGEAGLGRGAEYSSALSSHGLGQCNLALTLAELLQTSTICVSALASSSVLANYYLLCPVLPFSSECFPSCKPVK